MARKGVGNYTEQVGGTKGKRRKSRFKGGRYWGGTGLPKSVRS